IARLKAAILADERLERFRRVPGERDFRRPCSYERGSALARGLNVLWILAPREHGPALVRALHIAAECVQHRRRHDAVVARFEIDRTTRYAIAGSDAPPVPLVARDLLQRT